MNNQTNILIVDDDPNILEVLEARLRASDFNVFKASDGHRAVQTLNSESIKLMISDVKMPQMNGMDLFQEVRRSHPDLPVIFLTAYGTIPDAVDAVKNGAADYIAKPFDGKELIQKINEILSINESKPLNPSPPVFEDGFYWGNSPVMKKVYQTARKVAASNVNVLILGESGVGKERVAKFIHNYSSRKKAPYIVVDCGTTPGGILESELFGHIKGAFTHAVRDKTGLIEAAHTGTLFLDEVGNVSTEMQLRLLRFLENKKIRRVGDIVEKSVDSRVLAATNADLQSDIEEGNFRQDLYFRLKGITIHIPPLRLRKEDIPGLCEFFVQAYVKENGLEPVKLSEQTKQRLDDYDWPGNVRELKNTLEAGIVLCKNSTIRPLDLQLEEGHDSVTVPALKENEFSIEDSERKTIMRALKQTGGVQKRAAELLKISRRSIHYKIKKLNIKPSDYKN